MIDIYNTPDSLGKLSLVGDMTSPFFTSLDGVRGGSKETKLYVRNDDIGFWYDAITVKPVFTSGDDIISGLNGFSWKLNEGDPQPSTSQWDSIAPGNMIVLPDIGSPGNGDNVTYLPFWVRIEIPTWVKVKAYQNVSLQLEYLENVV